MVARQFIAWKACENGNRPVGYGMIGSDKRATIGATKSTRGKDHTVLRDGSFSTAFPAINCLATIIQSLRGEVLILSRCNAYPTTIRRFFAYLEKNLGEAGGIRPRRRRR
jgi:hypothetical protein